MSVTSRQQGFVMPLLLILVVATVVAVLLTQLLGESPEAKRAHQTTTALAQAKAVLLAYAASGNPGSDGKPYGVLPCPDRGQGSGGLPEGSESGSCGSAFENSLGRLPRQSLKLDRLADGDNECLWYAVSGNHKSSMYVPNGTIQTSASANSIMLNEDTPALLRAVDENNNALGGDAEVIAIVAAAGGALNGQSRSKSQNYEVGICGGNYTASSYLDSFSNGSLNVNNAEIATNSSPNAISTFVQASASANFNDRIVTITRKEVFDVIAKRNDFLQYLTFSPTPPSQPPPPQALPKIAQTIANCIRNKAIVGAPPTAAAVNLGSSWSAYANSANYVPQAAALSGRLPADWVNSPGNGCALTPPENVIYKHWKDHFFYVLSSAFASSSAVTSVPCGANDCVTVNGGSTKYAAIVIFSGLRLATQVRAGASLGDINQYLEGRNANNHPNTLGNGNYQSATADSSTFNDFLVCIPTDLSQPIICP